MVITFLHHSSEREREREKEDTEETYNKYDVNPLDMLPTANTLISLQFKPEYLMS
jgi:hypothetical protein